MKTIKLILITAILIITNSCSSSGSDSSCNEIVCGSSSPSPGAVGYYLYRGTLEPDTCGLTLIEVNETTFNYYEAKMAQNPEGYACWEGLK